MNRRIHLRNTVRRARARHVLAGVALFLLAGAGPAAAASPAAKPERRVLLVVDRPNDPLLERIRAEVIALGLTVVTRPSTGPLEEDARAQHAVAAIRVLPSRKGVEVWMADATTGRTLARQLVVDERPQGPDYGLVALQTTEILRTGLFGTANGARKPREPAVVPPPPPPPPPPSETTNTTSLLVGLGTLSSRGEASSSLSAYLSLEQTVWRRLGIALDATLPIRRASLSHVQGSADVAAYLVGLAVFVRIPPPDAPWFLTTGAGGAIVHVRTEGWPITDLSLARASSNGLVGAAYVRADAGFKPARRVKIGVAAIAGSTFPRVSVRFTGDEVATWGGGFLAALAVVGAEWE